jgi:simple sugar transport system ATP-binding protein
VEDEELARRSGPPVRLDLPGETDHVVDLRAITKSFFGSFANDKIDLDLRSGEIHALLGENGAGKSTLCSILAGLYRPDAGTIAIDGVERVFHSPRDALEAGVGMVYQHFRLVDPFTVAENLALGHPDARARLSSRQIEREARALCDRYGIAVDPTARIYQLSVGEQQRVEILKLLHRGVRILVLDEPTAVLTPQESEALFNAMRAMKHEGRTVVFVSHKLPEVIAVSDRITVLRHGKRVGQMATVDADEAALARMMIGKDPVPPSRGAIADVGAEVLTVRDLRAKGDRGNETVNGITFAVRAGEIVGIAGVAGNGQRELAEVIAGLRRPIRGTVTLNARDITDASVAERIRFGLAFVPEDRLETGVAAGLPIEDNLVLKTYRRAPFSRGPFVSRREVRREAAELERRFDIRGAKPGLPVSLLSGGNLQRAILAREISSRPTVLVAASPTRGLDVGATASVRQLLLQQRSEHTAILLISEDLDELTALSDRILVIVDGRIAGEVTPGEYDAERIGLLMAGEAARSR